MDKHLVDQAKGGQCQILNFLAIHREIESMKNPNQALRILLSGVLCLSQIALAEGTNEIQSRIEKILSRSRIRKDELGLIVGQSKAGSYQTLFSLNAEKSLIPASLTKIITAAGVLDGLGPSLKLETKLMSAAAIKGDQLEGDLYLVGGGDPGFVSETMWFLVNEFRRTGVKTIQGHVIVDDSRFDRVRSDESRQDERVDRAFDAPVGAMSYNWNSVNIFVRPGAKAGEGARVVLDPEGDFVRLEGSVKTTHGKGVQVNVERKKSKDPEHSEVIHVSGQIGVEANEFVAYKNITAPDRWSGINLIQFLAQRGIKVKGEVKIGTAPKEARLLARAESKPVAALVSDMLKFSNNFVAEMLVKNLAAESGRSPATLAAGVGLIQKSLPKFGLDEKKVTYLNPSGFTRENRTTASDLNSMMIKMKERFDFFPEFASALPIGGVDGTLKSRMKGSLAHGRIRAKTGLLNGVVGLAGFAGKKESGLTSFVFIFNGRGQLGEEARQLFDQLATELVQ